MEFLNGAIPLQTDYALCEYLLVAYPSREVNEMIIDEKSFFDGKYQQGSDIKIQPHLTIAGFLAKEAMEETFTRWIQNICNLQKGFMVTLNNYSGFPPHGLYLRVLDAEPFKKLANALKILDGFMQSNGCPPLTLAGKPHISFVTGLSEYVYEKAIKEYSQKFFHASFTVDRLVLLKKDPNMKNQLINTFILPPPETSFD